MLDGGTDVRTVAERAAEADVTSFDYEGFPGREPAGK